MNVLHAEANFMRFPVGSDFSKASSFYDNKFNLILNFIFDLKVILENIRLRSLSRR